MKHRPQKPLKKPVFQYPGWVPLDADQLNRMDSDDTRFYWLYAPLLSRLPVIGEYVWQLGPNPCGFDTEGGGRFNAQCVTHVIPLVVPAAPPGEANASAPTRDTKREAT